jgi:hypothetical protein
MIWAGPLIPAPPLREDMDPDLPALALAAMQALDRAGRLVFDCSFSFFFFCFVDVQSKSQVRM